MSYWKRIPAVIVILNLVVGFLLPVGALASAGTVEVAVTPAVVINEIMWPGSTKSSTDEWIELRNTTSTSIDLSGWKITGAASGGSALTIPSGKTIAANGFFVIAHYAATDAHSVLNITPDWVTTSIVCKNSDVQYVLSDASGTAIDRADDGSGAPLAGDNTTKASMERNATPGDGTLASSWHTAFSPANLDSGATELATPDAPNSNHPPLAVAGDDQNIAISAPINFDASDSEDPDGTIVSYAWDFGDGESAAGAAVQHVFSKTGTYVVRLTVVDDAGLQATDEQNVTVVDYAGATVRVNELLPNPTGDDGAGEWIELYNFGSNAVDLSGWMLDDAPDGSSPYTFPSGTTIAAKKYLVAYRTDPNDATHSTGIALNNDADSARLIDPTGAVHSEISYSTTAPEGQAYALTTASWDWVAPTANAVNAEVQKQQSDDQKTPDDQGDGSGNNEQQQSSNGQQQPATPQVVSIADAKKSTDGSMVIVDGVVTALPDTLASHVFYIQDASAGIAVYASTVQLPQLLLGDVVRVTGALSKLTTGSRITLSGGGTLVVTRHDSPFPPRIVATGKFSDGLLGSLVQVSGTIVKTDGATFYLDDGSGQTRVVIEAGTGIKKPAMAKGDHFVVTGVLDTTSSGYRVLPRLASDIRDPKVSPAEGSAASTLVAAGASVLAPILSTLLLLILCLGAAYGINALNNKYKIKKRSA